MVSALNTSRRSFGKSCREDLSQCKTHRFLRVLELDWDSNLDDAYATDEEDETDDSDSDEYGSETDIGGEEDIDEGNIGGEDIDDGNIEQENSDEEDSDEEERDEATSLEDSDNNDSMDEEEATKGDEEHTSAEATTNDHQSNDPEGMMPHSPFSTSDRDGDANSHIVIEDNDKAAVRTIHEPDLRMPGKIESDVDG